MLRTRRPTKPITWPENARIAVLLTFDTQGRVGHQYYLHRNGKTDVHELKQREYGGVVGVRRVLDILDRYGVKATFPTSGKTAEVYPEIIGEVARRGHEVAAHAYQHEKLFELDRNQEKEVMKKAIGAIQKVTGKRPLGWRSPWYWSTDNTIELNMELGFEWNSDYHDDDVPYVIEDGESEIVEIPPSHDDWRLFKEHPYDGRILLETLKDEFAVLYDESAKSPKRFIVTYHPLVSGRPERSKYLAEMISYVQGFRDVWFARGIDVANWWKKNRF